MKQLTSSCSIRESFNYLAEVTADNLIKTRAKKHHPSWIKDATAVLRRTRVRRNDLNAVATKQMKSFTTLSFLTSFTPLGGNNGNNIF